MSEETNEHDETKGESKSPYGEPERATAPCPECRGGGVIALLVTSRPCTRCDGTGWAEPTAELPEPQAPAPALIACEGYSYDAGTGEFAEAFRRSYDAQGRLTSETIFGGVETETYWLSDTDTDVEDEPSDAGPDADE